jgi:hypothetical protein
MFSDCDLRDIVESRVRVQEGKRRRILPLEVSSKSHDGARKGYATRAPT